MTQVVVREGTPFSEAETSPQDDEDGTPAQVPSRGNRIRMLVLALASSWFAAMACNTVIEVLQSGGDVQRLVTYSLDEARLLFLLSSTLIWLAILGGVAVLGRLWITLGLFTAVSAIIGFASYQKTVLRQEPIYPSDLAFARQAGFLREMVGPAPLAAIFSVVVLVLLISVLVGRFAGRLYPPVRRKLEPRRWRALLIARLLVLVLAAATLSYAGGFNESDNRLRAAYDKAGASWAFWFQKVNYARNGFLPGFLYNLPGPAMAQPDGYSREAMAALTQEYGALADRLNEGRSADALDDVNVVMILSEAFSDPTAIEGPTYDRDPIPFTRSLMDRTRSGTMLAQLYGGGTANMEFEALTGMSLSQFLPQMNTPYQQLVSDTPTFPSAVGYLGQLGHRLVGVHPYMTTMYKRYAVYPTLGFERFVDEDHMQRAERIGDEAFISDASSFDEVLRQLEDSSAPALVNLVTMQNHYPMAGKYDDPVPVEGVTGDVAEQLSHYLRGLELTDTALKRFVGELRRSDEKTMVVMYGDHAPAFWSGDVYEANGDAAFRRTPYFMWSNFQQLPAAENAITSPIYFLPTMLDDIGAVLPPYYALLLELQTEIAAMEQGEYHLPDGRVVSEDELGGRAQQLLDDYRLVQYDLAVGERWSQDGMFYPAG